MTRGTPIIDISVVSRFHAFELAHELCTHQMLRHLHSGYPAFFGSRFGVPARYVRSVWTGEPLNRALSAMYRRGWLSGTKDHYLSHRHDRIVAARLRPGANVFIGWSGQCRLSLDVARRMGMKTIVERGSTHIEWQRDQLLEEMQRTGLTIDLPGADTIEQEVAEYEAADFIEVPSSFASNTFVSKGIPRTKLLVNPYGVDLSLFSAGERQPSRQPGDPLHVLHVGRVSARKGVHSLVEAIGKVSEADVTFVGAVDIDLSRLSHERKRVRIVGPVPGRQLPQWYRQAHVFCLLSIEEGLALVLAQAMAMGLPVIATPNTGVEELIEDGVHGFIVPARDPDAAAARLRQLADDEDLRREMGERARARIARGFDWAHYGDRARAQYARITSGVGSGSIQ